MKLSVIIPTYQRSGDLPRLFDSLVKQIEKLEEVIIVIGPGDKESMVVANEWAVRLPVLQIFEAQKGSVIHSLNLGFSKAINEIICLLDDDVWLPPDWSMKIRDAFEKDENLGAFGGRDHLQHGGPILTNPPLSNKVGGFSWNGQTGNHHCGSVKSPIQVEAIKGVNLSFRRSAFKDMKIDNALESQGAETCWEVDICQRIRQAGYHNIYDNNNYVLHYWSPRLGFDNRTDMFSPTWPKRVYNESFVLTKFRPFTEFVGWSLRLFLIGTRVQPGIVWSILLLYKSKWKVLTLPWRNIKYIYKGFRHGLKFRKSLPGEPMTAFDKATVTISPGRHV